MTKTIDKKWILERLDELKLKAYRTGVRKPIEELIKDVEDYVTTNENEKI